MSTTRYHDLGPCRAERRGEGGGHRVRVLAGDHGAVVGDRQDQRETDEASGRAADVDGAAHRLGDHLAGIRHLLRHVTARLKAVVHPESNERPGDKRREVGAAGPGAEAVEEHTETVFAMRDEQPPAHDEASEELRAEAEEGRVGQRLRADEVDEGRDGQHDESEHDGRPRCRCHVEKRGDVGTRAVGDGRDGDQQRPQVDPAGHPRVLEPPQAASPWVDPAGHGELRDDLAEGERHHQLTQADDEQRPDHRRTGRGERVREHRVDADDW